MKPFLLVALCVAAPSLLHAQASSPFASGPWSGNITATSATAVIHGSAPALSVRWVVSERVDLSSPLYSPTVQTAAATGNVTKFEIQGLRPATDYYYGFEVNGTLRSESTSRGRFRTFPLGAASFKIAFASCGDYRPADQSAYAAILAEQPLLFLNTGDLHYSDTNSTNPADYRNNYDGVLTQPTQAALYRGVPVAYMWDDHDYCGNDSDGASSGRDTARQVYGEFVPHYPLPVADGSLGQAFTIGRVRVILTDLRSASSPLTSVDNAAKTHLGAAQKTWFKQELITARDAGFPLILWISPTPWIGAAGTGVDAWSVYATERREIANFLKTNLIKNVVLLCGDMHALAYDDGTHSDYADGGGAPLIVLHAAALTSAGSSKGGPYTAGPLPGSQQYGMLEITDNGGASVQCHFTGKRAGEGTKLSYDFRTSSAVNLGGTSTGTSSSTDRAFVNVSSRDRIATADGVCIAGFVIGGSSPRNVLLRAVGPSLAPLGVTDPLPDPTFTVHHGNVTIAANDNWADAGAAALATAFSRVGAFDFLSPTTRDAAMVLRLDPGVYSMVARSVDGSPGTVLLEVYDIQ